MRLDDYRMIEAMAERAGLVSYEEFGRAYLQGIARGAAGTCEQVRDDLSQSYRSAALGSLVPPITEGSE